MGEAEKTEKLAAAESVAPIAEAASSNEVFDQMEALIARQGFNLRGKVKKCKEMDKAVKEEMLEYIDEGLGLLSLYDREGVSKKLTKEAIDCFNIIQEMAEKHLSGYAEQLEEYSRSVEKKNSAAKNPKEKKEISAELSQEDSERSKKVLPFVKPDENIMEKVEERIDKNDEGIAAPSAEADLAMPEKNTSAKPKSAMIEKEGADAGKNSESGGDKSVKEKNSADEYQGESDKFRKQAERFRDVREAANWNGEGSEKRIERKRDAKKGGGGGEKEPPGGESEEKIKKQLAAAYEIFYGFLHDKKEAPKKSYDEIAALKQKLYGVVKNRTKAGEIMEELKKEYRKIGKDRGKKAGRSEKNELEKRRIDVESKKKTGFTQKDIELRAADIERRRREGKQPGFTWAEIDKMLDDKELERGSEKRNEEIKRWDRDMAIKELAAESRNLERLTAKISDPEYQEIMRKFFQIVLNCDLREPDGQGGFRELSQDVFKIKDDEKLNAKILELAKENLKFAVHGNMELDKDGNWMPTESPDLDGLSALHLLKKAGFKHANLNEVVFVKKGETGEGRFNIDTGNVLGFVLEGEGREEGKTAKADHHLEDKPNETSASEIIYKILNKLDLLPKYAALRKTVEFVTMLDNKSYLNDPRFNKYFENYFTGSWKTILGLQGFIKSSRNLELIESFFQGEKSGGKTVSRNLIDICKELDDAALEKLGFIYSTQNELEKREKDPNYEIKIKNLSEVQQKNTEAARQELERLKKAGFIVPSGKYGRLIVDIGRKLKAGIDLARAYNCGGYISWSPRNKSFFINTLKPLKEKFDQGIGKRGMWFKPLGDNEELTLKLGDVLMIMTDGKFEPKGELAEYLAKEEKEKETEKILSPEKMEMLIKAGRKFYEALKEGASWDDYSEERKKRTLEDQTAVSLTKWIKKLNLIEAGKIDETAEMMVKEIIGRM